MQTPPCPCPPPCPPRLLLGCRGRPHLPACPVHPCREPPDLLHHPRQGLCPAGSWSAARPRERPPHAHRRHQPVRCCRGAGAAGAAGRRMGPLGAAVHAACGCRRDGSHCSWTCGAVLDPGGAAFPLHPPPPHSTPPHPISSLQPRHVRRVPTTCSHFTRALPHTPAAPLHTPTVFFPAPPALPATLSRPFRTGPMWCPRGLPPPPPRLPRGGAAGPGGRRSGGGKTASSQVGVAVCPGV
jgi:hypothetical protein